MKSTSNIAPVVEKEVLLLVCVMIPQRFFLRQRLTAIHEGYASNAVEPPCQKRGKAMGKKEMGNATRTYRREFMHGDM